MLVDSGSFISILSSEAVQRYGLTIGTAANYSGVSEREASHLSKSATASYGLISGIGGSRTAQIVSPEQVSFGRLHGSSFVLLTQDWDAPRSDPPVDGLVGADVLGQHDVDYDVLGGKLTLYTSQGVCGEPPTTLDGDLYEADMLSDRPDEHRAMVSAEIEGRRFRALLDTGASGRCSSAAPPSAWA